MRVQIGDVALDLTDEQVESLRAQLAVEARTSDDGLIDAAEVARRLGYSRDYVYAHADELGVVRGGTGPRPRLRFDPAALAARPDTSAGSAGRDAQSPPEPPRPRRRRSSRRREGELLPIRGERP